MIARSGLNLIGLNSQSRLVPRRRVLVEDSLLDRLVDRGDGRREKGEGLGRLPLRQKGSKLLDLRAEPSPVGGVDGVASGILPIPFLG